MARWVYHRGLYMTCAAEIIEPPLRLFDVDEVSVGDVIEVTIPNQRESKTQRRRILVCALREGNPKTYLVHLALGYEDRAEGMALPPSYFALDPGAKAGRFAGYTHAEHSADPHAELIGRDFPTVLEQADQSRTDEQSMYGDVVRALVSQAVPAATSS